MMRLSGTIQVIEVYRVWAEGKTEKEAKKKLEEMTADQIRSEGKHKLTEVDYLEIDTVDET